MSEESWSRKDFKLLALIFLAIGLLILIVPALYSLLELMISEVSKPFIYVNNIIGNAILNIVGNNPLLFLAFFFITTAAIFGVGYFIKDDYERNIYHLLIYLSWFLMILLGAFLEILSIVIMGEELPKSIMMGFDFLMLMSPPFMFMIYKGLKFLINPKGS